MIGKIAPGNLKDGFSKKLDNPSISLVSRGAAFDRTVRFVKANRDQFGRQIAT